uniref:cytochrome P450 4C1-like n=1 Tax=Harmonia axyridis TaxID=115357 RepID=UPI003B50743C
MSSISFLEKMLPSVKLGIWMAFFTLLLLIGKMLYRHLRDILVLLEIPAPPAKPIIGLGTEFFGVSQEEIFRKFREYSKQFRPVYRLPLFHIQAINLINSGDIEQVLSSYNHLKKSMTYDFLNKWLGTGLLTSSGEKWHARRKLLTPTFHFKILQDFLIAFNEETNKFVEKINGCLDDAGVDISKFIDNLTLQAVGETAMGLELVDEGIMIDYRQNLRKMGKIIIERITKFFYRFDFIYRWTDLAHEEKVVTQSLHRFSETVIRRRKVMRRGSTIERKRLAMLDLLLQYKEEGADIDDLGIREEVDTFLFEGHDTTSIALSMLILLLANHKEVQERVIEEIDQVLGKKAKNPTHEDLPKLEYLECCIKETLRLYPSVPSIGRIAGEDFTTTTGYRIPKGTIMLIQIYDLHRDASVFPEPEKFNPDRFKPENTMNRNSFAYIPFSAGPRNCIGQKFAMWEMKAVMCGLLQHFKLAPIDTPMGIKFYTDLILRTNCPIKVKFIKRQ